MLQKLVIKPMQSVHALISLNQIIIFKISSFRRSHCLATITFILDIQFRWLNLYCDGSIKNIWNLIRGVVAWERVGTAFPHLFLVWERVPTPLCTSNLTWKCGIQKITLKHGCDLTDGLATRRFALLVKSVHSITRGSSVEILVGECSLYSYYLVQFF